MAESRGEPVSILKQAENIASEAWKTNRVRRDWKAMVSDPDVQGPLPDRYRMVLNRRLGIERDRQTVEEIAKEYNTSPARIKSLEGKARRRVEWILKRREQDLED